MNRKIVLGVLLSILFIISSNSVPISAYSTITLSPYSLWNINHASAIDNTDINTKYGVLPNGKTIVAWTHGLNTLADCQNYFVAVYNPDGTQYSLQEIPYATAGYYVVDISVKVISDTKVYFAMELYYFATFYYYAYAVVEYNPTTSAVIDTDKGTNINSGSSALSPLQFILTDMIEYNGNYFFMCAHTHFQAGSTKYPYVYINEYVPNTSVTTTNLDTVTTATNAYVSPIYWFSSPIDDQYAYCMYSSNESALSYYVIDLDPASPTMTLLSAMPVSTDEITPSNAGYSKYIDGGINVNGTQLYLYFTFINSKYTAPENILLFVQYVGIFNNSISSGTFLSHNRDAVSITTGWSSSGGSIWTTGFHVGYDEYYLYFPNWITSTTYLGRYRFTISDWYDGHDISYSYIEESSDNIPLPDEDARVGFHNHDTQWGICFDRGATTLYIYRDLTVSGGSYAISATKSPNDTPLRTGTAYTFTCTMTCNGLAYSGGIVTIKIDGMPLSSSGTKITNSAGITTWGSYIFSSTGVHNVTFYAYATMGSGTPDASVTYNYSVISGTEPSGTTYETSFLNSMITLSLTLLPTVLAISVPATAGAKAAGVSGFILGSIVGVLICVQLGFLPVYAIYLILLVSATAFILAIRMGGTGGA